jgi:hypothetical protein
MERVERGWIDARRRLAEWRDVYRHDSASALNFVHG